MAEQLTPEEQNLIARLQNAPQPELRPDAFEAIRAQMLNAMNLPPVPAPTPLVSLPAIVGALVVVIVVIGIVVIGGVGQQESTTPTPVLTTAPSATLPAEIATVEVTPEIVPSLTATLEPTATLTAEATTEPTPEITPETTLEPTLDSIIIIEGPIDEIRDNVIVIFGIEIIINPTDPILGVIQIDDVLHVEGIPGDSTNVIIAITVIVVNIDVDVNPNTGEVWTDNGSCSNPPPDWAPANGWRRRCEQGGGNSNNPGGNNPGQGQGNGRGNNDDDD